MKIVGFTAELMGFKGGIAECGVVKENHTESKFLTAIAYEAILRCMKESNRDAFYAAMENFIDKNKFNDAQKFFEEMENDKK